MNYEKRVWILLAKMVKMTAGVEDLKTLSQKNLLFCLGNRELLDNIVKLKRIQLTIFLKIPIILDNFFKTALHSPIFIFFEPSHNFKYIDP